MKFLSFIFLVLISNCVVTNKLGLSIDRISGVEAIAKLKKAQYMAIVISGGRLDANDVYFYEKVYNAGINPNETYYKPEIDKCATSILKRAFLARGKIYTVNYDCSPLNSDKSILDKPFPEL